MKTSDFYFDLPEELIAQTPLKDRAASRLLFMDKGTGALRHETFRDVLHHLQSGDCLVINDTRVLPARLFGRRRSGAAVEFLLLKRVEGDLWQTLVKPGKKARPGDAFEFGDGSLSAVIEDLSEEGTRLVRFRYEGIFEEVLDRLGTMPLPPYIRETLDDAERYQTVYSNKYGSAAAPTAGLHFDDALLDAIEAKGVTIARITLHVGLGTFRPVKAESIHEHVMHAEYFEISEDAAAKIQRTKAAGGRVIAVGTTSVRTLESAAGRHETLQACSGWTDIFIYPGYTFKVVDGLITNFHLPESTLIMLVSALAGREHVLVAYDEAVKERYRFFSFGDAMLIL
ncbi:tRNA preQ1(34) S-adenosylmethionine ribosyltransferase-isomerase QueA [Acidaminobacter sp.]|uniref:tRNA preQ1(34) S-adenosylmethionine ribosyltransferase-isomerase QueA n=1 Tax=Acidaminobacter sp. TaxID=1872102 RepID=UPI0013805646|nr:tRNA preQ1(34) S-adenosylmethionine ribosyltransferase-isomerase QueA [Acidaminobacter sp.]MDK9712110.1 tRNA preQ1(34) S-adenosylmethionine ribosyltransferase-isomerase QueA [Acidaminobacter sp.]MZQ98469.1 tRNA preQ1(34) S-adenosylmethionine ribosyltransferase-isomerase QueA [Acidaminobacter sp.]